MFNLHCYKTKLQAFILTTTSPSSICFPRFQLYRLPISLQFSSTASDSHSFAVSYLVDNCGFSTEAALKASKYVRFQTSEKPAAFLNFLRNHGFSNSQIHSIVSRAPRLLSCNSDKKVLPKLEFFHSKGFSASDIVFMLTGCPSILARSLQNHIIPLYGMMKGFLHSNEKTNNCIKCFPDLLSDSRVHNNVELLRDNGVANSDIARILLKRSRVLCFSTLGKAVQEVKQLGFDPSSPKFVVALIAKHTLSKSNWDEKVDTFKKWGWSEEKVLEAFKRQPYLMLKSKGKINAVMNYWVNHLGWDSLHLVRGSEILGLSLEKRIIPRASVVQFLLSKGLRKTNSSLCAPFYPSEEVFLKKFVNCFKEETPQLLKLYEENMNLQDKIDKGAT